jgi:UDPglucose--hexose-1-phosphate uridylyltransferase
MSKRIHIHYHRKDDGRALYLYGWDKLGLDPLTPVQAPPYPPMALPTGALHWNPLQEHYVCASPVRQNRTFKPDEASCPLCPSTPERITEIPFSAYDIAIFDNRFPSFVPADQAIGLTDPTLKPAHGKCEVVAYTQNHTGNLGTISDDQRHLLLEAWVHRYDTLLGLPDIEFVLPFENRGDEIGVTLHHPHGQIYALPFIPPIQQRMADSFTKDPALLSKVLDDHQELILAEDNGIVAFIPRFGSFSYEIWLAPRNRLSGLWGFSTEERQALSRLMGRTVRAYDALFNRPMPTIMALQSAPPRFEKQWHSHMTFYPFLRTADKLKYLAGVELSTGHYLKDVTAEDSYLTLKPLFDGATS